MSWRVLDFTNFEGRLSYKRGHLLATRWNEDSGQELNLHELAVILLSDRPSISGGLLHKLAELGIAVLITDWRGVPVGALQSWGSHSRIGARQIAQSELSLPRRKSAWAAIVKAKVRGQEQVQRELGNRKIAQKLHEYSQQVRSGDPTNVEGLAARLHWQHFVSSAPFTRNQTSSDPINICLNYGYTVLRGFAIRSILAAGLWPARGIFHHGRSNAFNLADDLIEPFRPVVDHCVANLEKEPSISDPEVKKALVGASNAQFSSDGTAVSSAMTELSQAFGRYVEGDTPKLVVPHWSGTSHAVEE